MSFGVIWCHSARLPGRHLLTKLYPLMHCLSLCEVSIARSMPPKTPTALGRRPRVRPGSGHPLSGKDIR